MEFSLEMFICRWYNEGGPMTWVSSTMDGNKQEGKWLAIKYKALKWAKTNNAPPNDHLNKSLWQMGWLWHHLHDYNDYNIKETQMHRMHEQKGWIIWCPHLRHKVLEIWPLLTLNWRCFPCPTKEQPNQGEGPWCIWYCALLFHNRL